jgi:C4-dicarboxylate-specific signal transduction histidine kinase
LFSRFSNWTFRGKFLSATLLLSLLVPSLGGLYLANETSISHKSLILANTNELANILSRQVLPTIEFDDPETAVEFIDAITENSEIIAIQIWKEDIFSTESKPSLFAESKDLHMLKNKWPQITNKSEVNKLKSNSDFLVITRAVKSFEQTLGEVILIRSLQDLNNIKDSFWRLSLVIWIIILFLVLLIALEFERSLSRPLLELVTVAEKISSQKNLKVRAKQISEDEFGRLTKVFNNMLDSINETNMELLESKAIVEQRVQERTDDLAKTNHLLQDEINEKEKKNQQLLMLQQQLARQERLASVGQVSSNIAHELRNPMAAIRNSVYFLRKNLHAEGKTKEHLDIIDQQLSASDQVIERLLDITKGKELFLKSINLEKACVEAIEVIDSTNQIDFSFKSSLGKVRPRVDKLLFRQILANIFLNSVQSTPENSLTKIQVQAMVKSEQIEVRITDNGEGISKDIIARVFNPLFTTKKDGFGLGLSLCKDLISRHGGEIAITESSSSGTVIQIKIPIIDNYLKT